MPIPKRNAGEDRDTFINRCISEMNVLEESNTPQQNMAICYAQLHETFSDEMNGGYSKKENTEKYNPSQSNNQ